VSANWSAAAAAVISATTIIVKVVAAATEDDDCNDYNPPDPVAIVAKDITASH
jgi:hypothetical protein